MHFSEEWRGSNWDGQSSPKVSRRSGKREDLEMRKIATQTKGSRVEDDERRNADFAFAFDMSGDE